MTKRKRGKVLIRFMVCLREKVFTGTFRYVAIHGLVQREIDERTFFPGERCVTGGGKVHAGLLVYVAVGRNSRRQSQRQMLVAHRFG
jgi:hypothetical protein